METLRTEWIYVSSDSTISIITFIIIIVYNMTIDFMVGIEITEQNSSLETSSTY